MIPIRVVIADSHRLYMQGLKQFLELEGGFEVVGEAENGRQAVDIVGKTQPDVVLMDIRMSVLNGASAVRIISETAPNARVIILAMYRQDSLVLDAVRAGACGYLLKDADEKDLIAGIKGVRRGARLS